MKEFLKKIFGSNGKPKNSAEYLAAQRRKMINKPDVKGYINPVWEIEVRQGNEVLVKMPFCFLIHTHLKDYGFDPDSRVNNPPTVILRLDTNAEAKIPLFLKQLPKNVNQ